MAIVISAIAIWLVLNILMLVRGGNSVHEGAWVSHEEYIRLVNSGDIQPGDIDNMRLMIALPTYMLRKG